MEESKRIVYPDILRIIAIFGVINIHIIFEYFPLKSVSEIHQWILITINCLSHVAVPVFVMISGLFMLSPQKEKSIKSLYSKNILRIVIAFLFWSGIYTVSTILIDKTVGNNVETPSSILRYFIEGEYHLWYIHMILGLYIVTPILRHVVKNKITLEYFLVIWIVFCLLPNLLCFVSSIEKDVTDFFSRFKISAAIEYSGYYCLGYYIHNFPFKEKTNRIIYLLGSLCAVATITITVSFSSDISHFSDYLTPNIMLMSAAFYIFVKNNISGIKVTPKSQKIITLLSKYTFGVYLCHLIVLKICYFALLNYLNTFSLPIKYVILLLLTTIFSYLLSAIINKIPLLNKYIV